MAFDPFAEGLATEDKQGDGFDPFAEGLAKEDKPAPASSTAFDPFAEGLATEEKPVTAWFDRTVREQLPDGGVREQRVPDPFPGISEGAGAVSNWVNRRAGDVIGKVIGGVADEPIVQHVLRDPAAQTATAMLPVGWAAQGLKAATTLPAIAANAGRLGIAAGVGDVAMQGMQIAGGQRDAIDPQQTAAQTLAATAGGAVPGAGRVTSPLFAAKNPLTAMAAEVAVPAAGNSALGAGVNAATQLATTGTVDPGQMARAGVEWGTFGGLGGTANAIAAAQAAAVDRAGLIGMAKSKGFTNWDDFFNWYGSREGSAPSAPRAQPAAAGQLVETPAVERPAAAAPEPQAPAPVVPRAPQPPPPPTAEELFMQTRAAELARRPATPFTLEPAGAPNPGHPIPPSGAGIAQIQASPVRSAPDAAPAPVSPSPTEVSAAPRADLFDGGATGGDTTFNLAAQVGTDFGGYMDEQAARAEALAAQERAQQALPLGELSPEEFLPVSPATAADVTGSGIGQDRSVLAAANPAAAGSAAVPTADFQQRREAGNMAPAAPVRKFKLGSRPDGVPDVLDAIQELGGIGGPASVRHVGGGEYDGFREVFGRGAPRLLVKRNGQAVDQVIEQLRALGYHYDSPDAFYSAVGRAAQERQQVAQIVKAEKVQGKFMSAALDNEGRGKARTPNKGVPAITLPTGTKFKIHGEPFEVVGFDAQNNVIVRDGPEYGTQVVPAGADLYADKGSLRRAKGEQVTAMPFEPRGSEVGGVDNTQPARAASTSMASGDGAAQQSSQASSPSGQGAKLLFHGGHDIGPDLMLRTGYAGGRRSGSDSGALFFTENKKYAQQYQKHPEGLYQYSLPAGTLVFDATEPAHLKKLQDGFLKDWRTEYSSKADALEDYRSVVSTIRAATRLGAVDWATASQYLEQIEKAGFSAARFLERPGEITPRTDGGFDVTGEPVYSIALFTDSVKVERAPIPESSRAGNGASDGVVQEPPRPLATFSDKWEARGVRNDIYESETGIVLSRIVVPELARSKGVGTQFMRELIDYAETVGKPVFVTPSIDFGASSKTRLTEFYKRLGFKNNTGKKRDFSTKELMVWRPESSRAVNGASDGVVQEPPRPLAVDIFNETDGKPIKAALAAGNPAAGAAGGGWRESVGAIEQAAQRAISDRLRGDADLADELAAATAPGGRGPVFRPAEIIGAVAGERLPGEMGAGGLARTGVITEHARAFTSQFIRDGYLDLLGRKFDSPEQVVAALQWARNRACEVYWLFPYDKAGRMLPPVAITSRMPDRVWMPADSVDKINAHLRNIGAAYWDNAHNHPSGNPQPSAGDLAWTKTLRGLVTAAPLRHSLVIDHGRYAVIGDGTYTLGEIPGIASQPDPTARPIGADAWLGRSLGKIADVVQAAYGAQSDTNSVLLHVVGSRTSVNSVASVGVGDLSAPGFTEQLRELARKTGGVTSVAYYSGDRPEVHDRLLQLADEGILFYARPGEIVARPNPEKAAKAWMGQPLPRYKQVAEDEEELAPYEPENVLSIEGDGGTQGTQKLGGMEHVRPVEMPELVQMCHELTGAVPELRTLRKARGLFKPGEVKIVLDRRIFADPVQAQKTLAHELGHLDDYLGGIPPTLARGNLLGRIATLKKYLKNELPNFGATAKEVKAELQAVSDWWRPWDRATATPGFTRYRQSSRELYADALSVLYNSPEELKARAPLFWAGFWDYLYRKPEVSQQVHEIQTLLARGKLAVLRERSARLQASFARGDEVFLAHAAERANRAQNLNGILAQAKQDHYDIYAPIVDRARKVKAAGKVLPWHKDPEYVFDAHPLVNNENYVLLERVRRSVLDPIEAVGASDKLLGEYLFLNRVSHEAYLRDGDQLGRAHLANPQGHTPQTARQGLLRMRLDYGRPTMLAVEEAARKLQAMILDVVERGVAAGIYKPEALAHARENRDNYATFAVIDYLENSPHIPAGIKAQRGTLLDTANPFTASVLKLMTANKLIEHNQAKRVAIDLQRDHFPGEIAPAKVKKLVLASGAQMTQPLPAPTGKSELMVLTDGKPEYWWVEPAIADMFESRPTASSWAAMRVLSYAFRNLFYPTFISYNPAFQFWLNPMRDAQRNLNKLPPGVSRAKFYGQQAAARVTAVARLKEQVTGPELTRRRLLRQVAGHRALTGAETQELDLLDRRAAAIETIATKALPGPYESFVANPTNRQDYWQTMLADYGLMEGPAMNFAWAHEHLAPVMKVLDKMSMAGAMMEVMPKAAGYRALRKDLGWSAHEAAYYVRNHVGTPPHFKKGKWAPMDGTLIPFINIMTKGWATDWQQMRGKIPISKVTPEQQRWSYWSRMATSTLLPRVLKCLAAAGLLGAGLKELYEAVGDYDDTNYLCVPLGKVTSGKPEYGYQVPVLRLPQDETSRVLGGMLDMALTRALSDEQQAKSILPLLTGFAGGQLPGVNPAVSLADGWRQYLSGQNPIDNFRNQPLMSDWKFRAGGWTSTQPMLAWSLEQTGATNLVRWDSKAETMMETVLSATPVLNRAVKITDQGFRDRDRNLQELQTKNAALIRAAVGDDVNRLLAEHARLSALNALGEDHLTPVQRQRYYLLNTWNSAVWSTYRQAMEADKARARWPQLVKNLQDSSAAFVDN